MHAAYSLAITRSSKTLNITKGLYKALRCFTLTYNAGAE